MHRRPLPQILPYLLLTLATVLALLAVRPEPVAAQAPAFNALLFTKTSSFRHDSIDEGVAMFQQLAAANNFTFTHTEDAAVFTDAGLAPFDVLIMFQTSGPVWTTAQFQALQRYQRAGGGVVAVHNAADMNIENEFPWWDDLIGSTMTQHSAGNLPGTVKVVDRAHPSTAALPVRWVRNEEWYNFDVSPRGAVHVLATADETTYNPGPEAMGADHPISWCHNYDGGRAWVTAMGHHDFAYAEANFRTHLLGGVRWAAGVAQGDCGGTVWNKFQKVALDTNVAQPFEIDVAADGRVFFIERTGSLKVIPPGGTTQTVGTLSVYNDGEDGLVGLELDPNFATNNFVYLYYSPAGTQAVNRLSRFTLSGNSLVAGSEVIMLTVPAGRTNEPGHTGGNLEFGPGGTLFLSVGDDANPFESSGFTPIDERAGRADFDAQKSSSNTNDLRGKLLRITPQPNGTYTIPSGNLFAPGTANTRPEIFAMGFRNPFRFEVDPQTGWVLLADYGPDSSTASASRGPAGVVEWNLIKTAGNYGWPYCHGANVPYNDFNFATSTSGPLFNCAAPVNNSPNNTGLTSLPAARAPDLWYGYGTSTQWPEMGSGGAAPMAGPIYRFNAASTSPTKFPAYYSGTAFFYEWSRNFLREINLDTNGGILELSPFLPNLQFRGPMDMTFGPDGSLYVAEWGVGFGTNNPDDGIYRIDYISGSRAPIARAVANRTSGTAPLAVTFSSAGSSDPDGDPITFAWDFTNNGSTDSTAANPSFTYTGNGNFTARLTVRDSNGLTGTTTIPITVGNTAPTVTITAPPNGGMFNFGDSLGYTVTVTDPEGGVDCSRVNVLPALGHDSHAHPLTTQTGCTGTVTTGLGGHGEDANIFYVLTATYTDLGGAGGAQPLTGTATTIIQPKHKQAEHFSGMSGVRVVSQAAAEAGARVGDVNNNDWISFSPMSLANISSVSWRVSSPNNSAGTIELRADSPTGTLLATTTVPNTGGFNNYVNLPATNVAALGGTHTLFAVFKSGIASPYDVDALTFNGNGVGTPGPSGIVANTTYHLTAVSSSKRADVNGASTADGAVVHQWAAATGNNQRWTALDAGGGQFYLRAVHSNKCMTIAGSSTTPATGFTQQPCANGTNQRFSFTPTGSGAFTVRVAHSNLCLDVNANSVADGATLIQWNCSGATNQQWRATVAP